MSFIKHFDHVGITVSDLDRAIRFFEGLGLELEGRMHMEGQFVDDVIGIPGSRSEIATLKPPDNGARIELSAFTTPEHTQGTPAPMSNELGIRNVAFEVRDIQAAVDWAASEGFPVIGRVGQYEGVWKMAYLRGPDGIIVAVAERIG
jgi:catechol 2,3-dioxygenase-like lactoylglutathione lyase family enzyme